MTDTDKASAASLISNSIPSLPRRRSSLMITNNSSNQNNKNDTDYPLTLSSSSTTKPVASSPKSKSIDDVLSVPDPPTPQANDDDNSAFISLQEETEMILKHSRRNRRNSRRLSSGGGIGGNGSDKENESTFVFSSLPSPKNQNGSTNDQSPGKTVIDKEVDDSNMDWEDDNSNIHCNNDNKESNFSEGSANFQHHNDNDNQSDFLPGKESIYLYDSSDENDEDDINEQRPIAMSRSNRPPSFARDKKKRRSSFMIEKDTTMTLSSEAVSSASKISEQVVSKRHKRKRQSIVLPSDNYNNSSDGNDQLINTKDNEESTIKIHFDDDDESDVIDSPQKKRKTNSRRSMVIPDRNELLFGDAKGNGTSSDRNDNDTTTSQGGSSANQNTKMKPKKARSSILLSTIDFDLSNEAKEDSDKKNQQHLLHKSDTEDKITPKSPSSYYNHWKKVCPDKLKLVKESIRKFCSLPFDERYKSAESIIVEELSGYPLLNEVEKARRDQKIASTVSLCDVPNRETDSKQQQLQEQEDKEDQERQLINEIKRGIVTQMGILIPIMEAKKKEDTEIMEAGTGCRVERRRGKFKYFDKDIGKKVALHEYERRYLCELQQHRVLREARIEAINRAYDETVEIIPVVDENSTSDESLPVEEEQKRLCDKDGNNEHIDDTNQDIRDTAQDAVEESDNETLIQLADIPSRDEISDDPEIAAAQQELFDTFDAALQKYSDKILAIRERKKMG